VQTEGRHNPGRRVRFLNWLGSAKDAASTIQSIASTVALIVAGVWVLTLLDIKSQFVAEVNLDQKIAAYKVQDNAFLIQVDITLSASTKKSATFWCQGTIMEAVDPLSKGMRELVAKNADMNMDLRVKFPKVKELWHGGQIVVPANGSFFTRSYWAIHDYVPGEGEGTKVRYLAINSRFFPERDCDEKLQRNKRAEYKEVTTIFDLQSNSSGPSTQQESGPSSGPSPAGATTPASQAP
jgi:hypothetical protein